jgi:hypothetical protein
MGGSSKSQTVGYKYYVGVHMVLCHGPVDSLLRVKVDERIAWLGAQQGSGQITINSPDLFGGESREGGIQGAMDFEVGSLTQTQNGYLLSKLGSLVPAFRGVAGVVLRHMYMGLNPYLKTWSFRLSRIHTRQKGLAQWYDAKSAIPVTSSSREPIFKTFDPNLAATTPEGSADSVTVTGIDPAKEYLVITLTGPSAAWSRWLGYGSGSGYESDTNVPLWWSKVSVKDGSGNITRFWSTSYFTEAEAASAALSDPVKALSGSSTYKIWLEDDFLFNRGAITARIDVVSQFDMNPAHIIRECLTDPDWGMGYQESDIDEDSFISAADTLFSELMGISLMWDTQSSIEEFIKLIVKHIDAALYVDRQSGKFVLKLIRADYDVNSLPILDESNIDKISDFSRPSFGELTNSVTVTYWNWETSADSTITVQDIALQQMQGASIGTAISYPGFTNSNIATRVAQRDLRTLSTPLISCTIYANRDASELNIGKCFRLTWPDYDVSDVVMRVTGIAYGDGKTNRIRLQCVQDIFALPSTAFVAPTPPAWEDPSQPPSIANRRRAFEIPYLELVQTVGQQSIDSTISANSDVGYVGAGVARPSNEINARMWDNLGSGYREVGNIDFSPSAILNGNVGKTATSFSFLNGTDLDQVVLGTWAQIDEEIVVVVNISGSVITVGRGCLDTVPSNHTDGAIILFWDNYAQGDNTELVTSDIAKVKITTITGAGQLDLADAPEDTVTIVGRAARPYAPGNVKVNGTAYPDYIGSSSELSLSWSHRDRLQQTGETIIDTTSGDIGPEAGTTYTLRIYGEANTLLRTESAIAGTSYTYTAANEQADSGLPAPGSSDAYFNNVSLLLPLDGVNNSTTFTDVKGHAVTAFGDVKISTAQSQYGGASAAFDGSGDYLSIANDTALQFGSGDFTIELWARLNNTSQIHAIFDKRATLGAHGLNIFVDDSSGYKFWFVASNNGSTWPVRIISPTAVSANTWYHLAFTRSGNTWRAFVNGTLVGTATWSETPSGDTNPILLGRVFNSSFYLNGYIDDVRVTKGVARYVTSFTPTGPNPTSAAFRLNGKLRFELESVRSGKASYQKHDHTVRRPGYGFNYGESYGGI